MENPIGLNGLEFIEFTSPDPESLGVLFSNFGFTMVGKHKTKSVFLYRQGKVNFIVNNEPKSFSSSFKVEHGPSICAMALRVKDPEKALELSIERGAKEYKSEAPPHGQEYLPAIYGIGDSLIYFVEDTDEPKIYDSDFKFETDEKKPIGLGFHVIDHLTHNVAMGEMDNWCRFYESIFNFKEIKYFDIRGRSTGLISKVMRSPCGKITIPINEPTDPKSQIQEYLNEYKGAGIQHLALLTNDILKIVSKIRDNGIRFLTIPDTYYELLPNRLSGLTENIEDLRKLRILADGDSKGYLLQIFTENLVGPIFIEVIQRKRHSGFGEGNFQALFEAMELDQIRRGVL